MSNQSRKSNSTQGDQVLFQDMPFLDRDTRLTVFELKKSDKQIVNELVYRWCRLLTRGKFEDSQDNRRVLIIDLTGAISLTRLATVVKEDYTRMQMIDVIKACKINSTYITLSSYLGPNSSLPKTVKLVVIYQDEFYIKRTLKLLEDYLLKMTCKILLIVPKLDRSEREVLNLFSKHQVLKCDFRARRRDIGPALSKDDEQYQNSLNKVYFQRCSQNRSLPDIINAQLEDDGLHKLDENTIERPSKRIRIDG